MIICRSIHVPVNGIIHSLYGSVIFHYKHVCVYIYLWPHNIPLCIYTQWNGVYTYISHLLIHSPVSGQLGCFYVLAIANSAAMNIGMHGSFCFFFLPPPGLSRSRCPSAPEHGGVRMALFELRVSLDICPRVGLKDHMVALFLVF